MKIEKKSTEIVIIIPCFNESKRLAGDDFLFFLKANQNVHFVFVDDGSSDTTYEKLTKLKTQLKNQISILKLEQNKGKANAVREGVLYGLSLNHLNPNSVVGFIDADLATPLDDAKEVYNLIKNNTIFAFGSRIKKLDSYIDRRIFRHLIGRVIATIIDYMLKLGIYDTQCGCKFFNVQTAQLVFKQEFISKWLFDVEIFFRLKQHYSNDYIKTHVKEIPLLHWIDMQGSKIKLIYCLFVFNDLCKIFRCYRIPNYA